MQEKYSRSWFLLRSNISQNCGVAHENLIRCSPYNWIPRRNFSTQFLTVLNIAQCVNRRIEGGKTSQCSLELGIFPQIRTIHVYFQKFLLPPPLFPQFFTSSPTPPRARVEIFHDNVEESLIRADISRYVTRPS